MDHSITILTGRFETGTAEERDIVTRIFGANDTVRRYRLYFYWYNTIHEVGHYILQFNKSKSWDDVDEEMLVNRFAAAYWEHYGEAGKRERLKEIVQTGLGRYTRPALATGSALEYAKAHWENNREELFSFNNYGWFQFSLVSSALANAPSLKDILVQMQIPNLTPQPRWEFRYNLDDEDLPFACVYDAVQNLRLWGLDIDVPNHIYVDSPSRHGLSWTGGC